MSDVTLIYGDCLEVMPTLPQQKIALVISDLPYASVTRKTTDCTWDIPINLAAYWRAVRDAAPNATHAMTATQPFAALLVCSNLRAFRYDLIWDKKRTTGHLNANRAPMRSHEHVLIFADRAPLYFPQMSEGVPYIRMKHGSCPPAFAKRQKLLKRTPAISLGGRYPKSIMRFEPETGRNIHPTQKPVALLEWLIKTYTEKGDTILDPVAGSGTTAIAAMRTGRKAICIERDATYFASMTKRVADERARMQQLQIANA